MLYLLIITHWVADFICQSDWMARNKSKSFTALGLHILAYTICLNMFSLVAGLFNSRSLQDVVLFSVINGAAHFVTDAITSRMTSKLWAKGDVHNFFVVIGADQAIHMCTLLYTYNKFLG